VAAADRTGRRSVDPGEGERNAIVGYQNQYALAAGVVVPLVPALEWIRVADPSAGVADDFQWFAGVCRHAVQVKWSQYPSSFTWAEFANTTATTVALVRQLASAWLRIRREWAGEFRLHLRSNEFPSASESTADSPLKRSTVGSGPKHFAAFLARSFWPVQARTRDGGPSWAELRDDPVVSEWAAAWDAIFGAADLSEAQFVAFLRDLDVHFVSNLDLELLPERGASWSDQQKFAAFLAGLVADPERLVQLSRDEVLSRLGWVDLARFRNPHRFPVPESYAANEVARAALEQRMGELSGGYLALVAPAGSGKSTLLASVDFSGRAVRYYAFVPDATDPLSGRGEADSFFHDVSLAMEDAGVRRSGFGNDLLSQRSVFHQQLETAGQRFVRDGVVTTIVVDGLDHVSREQRPVRSFLDELPSPAAVPNGVFIVLGTQRTDILPRPVQDALAVEGRTVELPPLAASEARRVVERSDAGAWLYPGQLDSVVAASEGHPLALTYILRDLDELTSEEDLEIRRRLADSVLSDASAYGSDIESRYRGYLADVGSDADLLELLGLVSRLRSPLSIEWLSSWSSARAVNAFVAGTSTFFRKGAGDWRFVHNSFRQFLANETARVGGVPSPSRDRGLHGELAERCAASVEWPVYRDEELAHRFLAGEFARVLEAASPGRLRASMRSLRPLETVREWAALGLRAAAEIRDFRGCVRMLMFVSELGQREYTFEPKALAASVAVVAPSLVMSHVVSGTTLRLEYGAALSIAAGLARQGRDDDAERVLRAAGGLAGLRDQLGGRAVHGRDWLDAVPDWAEVTYRRAGLERVLAELDHVLPCPTVEAFRVARDEPAAREKDDQLRLMAARLEARALAHGRCFDLAMEVRDTTSLARIAAAVDPHAGVDWRARFPVLYALEAERDGDHPAVLERARELLRLGDRPGGSVSPVSLHLRLAVAHALVRVGLGDAPEVHALVPSDTLPVAESWTSRDGLDDYLDQLELEALLAARGGSLSGDVSFHARSNKLDGPRGAGRRRWFRALATMARLEGEALATAAGGGRVLIAAQAEPIIRLFEVPFDVSTNWTGWFSTRDSTSDLFRRLIRLSARAGGTEDLRALLGAFEAAWVSEERAKFWSVTVQQVVVVAAAEANAAEGDWARAHLRRIQTLLEAPGGDPYGRAAGWRQQAEAWVAVGCGDDAVGALSRAVDAGWGPGQHQDDTQLEGWLEWLNVAVAQGRVGSHALPNEVCRYASRLLSEGVERDSNTADAAAEVVRIAFTTDPNLACVLAELFCDQGLLGEAACLATVVEAAAADSSVDTRLIAAIQTDMVMPFAFRVSGDAVAALEARDVDGSITASIGEARALWTLSDEDVFARQERPLGEPQDAGSSSAQGAPVSYAALLGEMRNATVPLDDFVLRRWEHSATSLSAAASRDVARALVTEASRLNVSGALLGSLCRLAADVGEVTVAEQGLARALSRLSAYGWIRHTDGGSRLMIFHAALSTRNPALMRLAAQDLANALTAGSLRGQIAPGDLRRIAEVIGGVELVADSWPEACSYLDAFAPASGTVPDVPPLPAAAALARWISTYFGHPVRQVDFGARAVCSVALSIYPVETAATLAASVREGGWSAEAALSVLRTAGRTVDVSAIGDLRDALEGAVVGPDGILRALAARVLATARLPISEPEEQPLPLAYKLVMPPLGQRSIPELDRQGVPFIDANDPRQLVAPSDVAISLLAERADLDVSTVMRRAGRIATECSEPWLVGGHRAHAARLKTRSSTHGYRPWAFMAGRRALGIVLAELVDARRVDLDPRVGAYALGAIDENLATIRREPLDESMPVPWRPDGTADYDTQHWVQETDDAVAEYVTAYENAPNFVVAELAELSNLDWGRPSEYRVVAVAHKDDAPMLEPVQHSRPMCWDRGLTANSYPRAVTRPWDGELVVNGLEHFTDAEWYEWIAFHPAAAAQLGWSPEEGRLFGWIGPDGEWRARTELRVRGLLSHDPPLRTCAAQIWRVVLSSRGRTELVNARPDLTRSLRVTRTKPESRAEGRDAEQATATRALYI
jgi:hypothetical protein